MKKRILFAFILCISAYVYPQANGSFYKLNLGTETCLFKYEEVPDSISVETDSLHAKDVITMINPVTLKEKTKFIKDSVVMRKYLTLQAIGDTKHIHTRKPTRIDTITVINPVTLQEKTTIKKDKDPEYHVETEMSYPDFLLLLKTKFELRNPQKNLRVYSFYLYYETQDTNGFIQIDYPQTIEGVISRLNCLDKGGFILLGLTAADHGTVDINQGGGWLALIHIKN